MKSKTIRHLIAQDYQQFVSEDLDDLDVEISVAKQSLKRENLSDDNNQSQ